MKVAVSILSSNYDEEETIRRLNETDADYLHLDVMDGHFVANRTPSWNYLHTSKKPLDVHLMVSRPFSHISKYACLNTETIVISFEITEDITSILEYIKERGIKCGLAIKPGTKVEEIKEYLPIVDQIIVMTVEPGKGGQPMLSKPLDKIDELASLRKKKKYKYKIEVDGGVNDETIEKVSNADIVVSGSYICKSENFQERIDKLRL